MLSTHIRLCHTFSGIKANYAHSDLYQIIIYELILMTMIMIMASANLNLTQSTDLLATRLHCMHTVHRCSLLLQI